MKVNKFTTTLSIFLAGLISFYLTSFIPYESKWIIGIGSFLTLTVMLIGTVSVSFEYDRTTTLTRIISGLFLAILLASQIFFVISDNLSLPNYILVTGCTLIIYVLVVYGISQSDH